MIASFVNDNYEAWDQFLREFTYALRTEVREATGKNPAEFLGGRKLITPLKNCSPLHPMTYSLQTLFPKERPLFQDDNTPMLTSPCVQTWLHEHNEKVKHLPWCPQ
ncbi:hypothetical protein TNCV_3766541 [Trichonephila clavipes]|nr:hypothetical protein TNCV_3766541 [Trichonephila clavipes]